MKEVLEAVDFAMDSEEHCLAQWSPGDDLLLETVMTDAESD